jgi:hypothetical protein
METIVVKPAAEMNCPNTTANTALWFVEYVKRLAELYAQVIDDKRCKSWKCLFRKSASTNKSKQM